MNELVASVEYLLNTHKCVVIPRLGALLVQEKSAQILPSGAICAPCKQVVFNEEINHNDGILLTFWSNHLNVSINEAEQMLAEEVTAFYATLKRAGTVLFGTLGTFTSTNHGNLLFDNSRQSFTSPALLGFETLSILPLEKLSEKRTIVLQKKEAHTAQPKKTTASSQSTNKRPSLAIRQIATITAFIAMLIGTNNLFNTQSTDSFHSASLLSGEMASFPFNNLAHVVNSIKQEFSKENAIAKSASTSNEENSASFCHKKQSYYVVVANYTSRRQAIMDLQIMKEQFSNAAILEKDGSYKIYVGVFSEKNLAIYYLKEVRWRGLEDAFLLSAN